MHGLAKYNFLQRRSRRKEEGYLSELKLSNDGVSWNLIDFHCSIKSIAEQHPIVCDQELQLIRNIFSDCEVHRVQWRLEGGHSCGFQLNPIVNNLSEK